MMESPLTEVEVRVLGSLMEKEVTTPDNYPLSLSGVVAACNQTSNREPVMQLDEGTITEAIVSLRRRTPSLVRPIQPAGSRVTKYQHLLADALNLDARELAVLGVLMLRGPQTAGELHTRTARLAEFVDAAQVEATLEALIARQPDALAVRLPRRAGQREVRFAHLLSGEVIQTEAPDDTPASGASAPRVGGHAEQLATLQRTVDELRSEVASLRAQFDEFRRAFE
jgi:uncharacterized protein